MTTTQEQEARIKANDEAVEDLLTFFRYDHLPEHLQEISKPFHDLAHQCATMEHVYPDQFRMGLQRLLEAKDCMVRAGLNDQELTKKIRPNLVWVIKRVCETGYVESGRPMYFTTLCDILTSAGLRTSDTNIRSALQISGCHVERDHVDGDVLLEFVRGIENNRMDNLENDTKSKAD